MTEQEKDIGHTLVIFIPFAHIWWAVFVTCGEGHGNLLKYFCLENPMDKGAQRATYSPWGRKSQT